MRIRKRQMKIHVYDVIGQRQCAVLSSQYQYHEYVLISILENMMFEYVSKEIRASYEMSRQQITQPGMILHSIPNELAGNGMKYQMVENSSVQCRVRKKEFQPSSVYDCFSDDYCNSLLIHMFNLKYSIATTSCTFGILKNESVT